MSKLDDPATEAIENVAQKVEVRCKHCGEKLDAQVNVTIDVTSNWGDPDRFVFGLIEAAKDAMSARRQ